MIIGFNHNVTYRGCGFHVQTEDSGRKNPNLVTLLYHDGTIIASKKTVYADILKVDNLEMVIEDLAKEQHKGMLRSLTRGEFDERIVALGITLAGVPPVSAPAADTPVAPEPATPSEQGIAAGHVAPAPEQSDGVAAPVKIVEEPIVDKFRKPKPEEMGLEDLVYAYLTAGQKTS